MFTVLLLAAVLLGAPLFAVITAAALLGFHRSGVDLSVYAIEVYRIVDMPVLLAIPLFTFTGYLLSESRASDRLLRLTNALTGWTRGGVAVMALVACALFTALTGASGVTIIALGALLYPALKQAGYGERFSLGLITTSGSLGLLFPPSIALILYGVVAQQLNLGRPVAVDDLFLAGLLPGALMLVLLAAWGVWESRGISVARTAFSWRELGRAVYAARWEIPLPFLVLGGIYGGYFAISEAAAASVLYVLIVEVFLYREIRPAQLPRLMRDSMVLVGSVLIILGASFASTNYLIDIEVPTRLFDLIRSYIASPWTFLALLNVFLLILGMFLDIFSAIVIMVPIILPIAVGYGIHPVHLGIVFLANMQLGYFTPPVGMNLFIASYRFKRRILDLCLATLPFFAILAFAVLVITYWPWLSLVLLPGR